MQINGLGGVSAYNSYAKSNSGGFALPDIGENITTKGESKLSDENIKDKLLDMARRNVVTREYSYGNPYHSYSADWLKLQKDYVSFASPDRQGIINNTLSGLGKKLSMMMPRLNLSNNLMGLLMQHNRLFRSRDIGDNFINFKDVSGNLVAIYSQQPNGSWGFSDVPTNAETSRSHEFMQMWHDAQIQAGEEKRNAETTIDIISKGGQIDIGKLTKDGAHFDMTKLAAHGITYDAETGQTHVDKTKLDQMYNQSYSQK